MNLKTRGIVIKRGNFGEADKLLVVFTERFGKIRAISKGVRKIKSHLAGSLEPFMLLDLELHEGKTFFTVCGASIIKEFGNSHNDLKRISETYYVAELVDKFTEENQKSVKVFQLLCDILESVDKGAKNICVKAFCLKLLEVTGFQPELYNCLHCKEKVQENEVFWDEMEGGVICESCQGIYHHGKKISNSLIKLFRFFEKNSFLQINSLKITKELEAETDLILTLYIKNILERDLKSKNFMIQSSKE